MIVIILYFSLMFSYSRTGQWLGGRAWFRGIMSVPVLVTFIASVANLPGYYYPGYTSAGWLRFLVQPATVYLVAVLVRAAKKAAGRGDWSRIPWKDIFRI